MSMVTEKINRVKAIEAELKKIDKFLRTMAERQAAGKEISVDSHSNSFIYANNGNDRTIIPVAHILSEPDVIWEILQRRIVALEKEHDELENVLNIAERLFRSIGD